MYIYIETHASGVARNNKATAQLSQDPLAFSDPEDVGLSDGPSVLQRLLVLMQSREGPGTT